VVFFRQHRHPDQLRHLRRPRLRRRHAIAGQTFYSFTLENLRQFGALKAMGTPNGTLLRMILLQAILVGVIGYGLGVGLACLSGWAARNTELSFAYPGN
jgi:putative ABC transport system permease protein